MSSDPAIGRGTSRFRAARNRDTEDALASVKRLRGLSMTAWEQW